MPTHVPPNFCSHVQSIVLLAVVSLSFGLTDLGASEPAGLTTGKLAPHVLPSSTAARTVVEFTLDKGLPGKSERGHDQQQSHQAVHLHFHGENLVNWWIQRQGAMFAHQLDSTVTLTLNGITGKLRIRQYKVGDTTLIFDLKRAEDTFTGTVTVDSSHRIKNVTWPAENTVTGTIIKPADALAPKSSWPSLVGPNGTMATTGPDLIDDLTQARPLWRSDISLPVSYGNAPDHRYFTEQIQARPGGGSSSPVVVDGVIYQGFFRPNKSITWGVSHHFKKQIDNLTIDEYAAQKKLHPTEKAALLDHWRPWADDHMVAIDARTGATLWETVWPQRSFNHQTHKHRGRFGIPLITHGKVFYPNLHGHLMVMDAATGEPLWEYPSYKKAKDPGQLPRGPRTISPFVIGNSIIWDRGSRIVALSIEDGSEVWVDQIENKDRWPRVIGTVNLNGDEPSHVLVNTGWGGTEVALLSASSGQMLWKEGAGFGRSFDLARLAHGTNMNEVQIVGDLLVAVERIENKKEKKPPVTRVRCWRITTEGRKHLWASEAIVPDEGPALAVADGVVYQVGQHQVRCLALDTGKLIAKLPGVKAGSNPYVMVVGDQIIVSPEGQHGSQHFIFYKRSGNTWTMLTKQWTPPHPTTTAYNTQPLVHPVVDGRLFVRGGNGIYCYDLRKQAAGK